MIRMYTIVKFIFRLGQSNARSPTLSENLRWNEIERIWGFCVEGNSWNRLPCRSLLRLIPELCCHVAMFLYLFSLASGIPCVHNTFTFISWAQVFDLPVLISLEARVLLHRISMSFWCFFAPFPRKTKRYYFGFSGQNYFEGGDLAAKCSP